MVKLTSGLLEAGKSERGGFNRAQLTILNVNWPPEKGWKKRLVGTEIETQLYDRFISLKG